MPNFTFIDLFAGIGGMRLGLEAAGGKCVSTSEWDKFARRTYEANFADGAPILGDIRLHETKASIQGHDLLAAGFPCQPFSLAGVSKKNSLGRSHGFADVKQGNLFFHVAQVINDHQPKAFLLENVKNLLSHDKGNTFKEIERILTEDLDYEIDPVVINASSLVPQNRQRIFIVGIHRDLTAEVDFSLSNVKESLQGGPTLGSILHPEDGSQEYEHPYTEGPMAKVGDKYTLTPALWEYLRNYAEKHRARGNGFGFGLVGPEDVARTLSARYHKDGSEILVKRGEGSRPRRLTPRECSRLMGFDSPTGSDWKIPVSDTQAYRQFGNAVVPGIVGAIAKPLALSIFGQSSQATSSLALAA